jgi:galactonate dehydratase
VGERLYTRYGFRPVLESRAADILQPDIGNTGGIMETKKIAAMAEAFSIRIQPHISASPVSTAAALQIDALHQQPDHQRAISLSFARTFRDHRSRA